MEYDEHRLGGPINNFRTDQNSLVSHVFEIAGAMFVREQRTFEGPTLISSFVVQAHLPLIMNETQFTELIFKKAAQI